MVHDMKLQKKPFEKIKSGRKTVELRINDENLNEFICVKVQGLMVFDTFENLIANLPASALGYSESDRDYLRHSMYEVYSPDEEKKWGVVGIAFQILA